MDQKFENQLRDKLTLDRGKIADLTDDSLDTRIVALTEVVNGYDSPDKEGEAFKAAIAYIGQHPIDNYRAVLRTLRAEKRRRIGRRGGKMPNVVPWTDFRREHVDPAQFDTPEAWTRYEALAQKDPTRTAAQYREVYLSLLSDEHYVNSRYHVTVRRSPIDLGWGISQLAHLSIKRLDQQTIHDWRDLQRIKDELIGPECEGVELFPAQSRCVDTANQYHIWVIVDPEFRFPFGFNEGRIQLDDGEGGEGIGQRAFEA